MSSKRRYGYRFLTMGGRRFVELTGERFERLYEREQQDIIRTAKYTGEDIRKITKADWESMYKDNPPEIKSKLLQRYGEIARGIVSAGMEDIIITNYANGLRIAGREDLARRFERLARNLRHDNPAEFELLMAEVPDLYLFYKDKGRSHTKRQSVFNQETAEEQVEQFEAIIDEYESRGEE